MANIDLKKMKEFISGWDSKTLTTAGAVVICLALVYVVWDLNKNGITGLTNAFNDYRKDDIAVKQDLARALEGNTKIMEQVLSRQK